MALGADRARGAFALLYVFIIGGQAFPLDIIPGAAVSSSFGDGEVAHLQPELARAAAAGIVRGVGASFLLTTIGVRVLDFLPQDDFVALQAAGEG